ncbi:MAG: tetraacyldisaccharide 4'-kinase [Bacteroidota bacterium]
MKPIRWLLPLSWIYGLVTAIRNWFFDEKILASVNVGVPVISVGNITAGGTGKTPMVLNIISVLRDTSKRIAVVSRGYGRKSSGTIVVSDGRNILASVDEAGDEALMLAQKCGNVIVIVDEKRVRGAKKAVDEFQAEVIVLDDGFQHRYIDRMLDIVLIDSSKPPSATAMLPAGYRRESLKSLRRADAVVFTKVTDKEESKEMISGMSRVGKQIFFSSISITGMLNIGMNVVQSVDMLKGHAVVMFSGIASPHRFAHSVSELGAMVKKHFQFADHHRFTAGECAAIIDTSRALAADFILTTEKDAVRLNEFMPLFAGKPLVVLRIDAVVHEEQEWKKLLMDTVR